MFLTGLTLSLTLPLVAAPVPPGVLVLLAEQADYRELKAQELIYEGTLERHPGTGKLGGPVNPYRLLARDGAGKPLVYELHLPVKAHLLAGQVGQSVRITGKLAPVKVEDRTIQELWPARLEPLTLNLASQAGADGIYARRYWQPEEARKRGARQYIFRDGEQLAKVLGIAGQSPGPSATTLLARELRVGDIDWKKHMLVTVCAGLRTDIERLEITKAHVQGDSLTISYKTTAGGAGFGYPAETVLLDRFDGLVRFVEETPARPAPPRPNP